MTHGIGDQLYVSKAAMAGVFDVLHQLGYEVIGPTVSQGAIVYDRILRVEDLPRGWTDRQGPGQYRLERRKDDAWFGYVVGPHSWKQFLFPPRQQIAEARRGESGWQFRETPAEMRKLAFLGVRACELAAMQIQDRVFLAGPYVDEAYRARRVQTLVLAVNCTQAAATCFCTSMGTGPECRGGFDVCLTELADGFVAQPATEEGASLLEALGAVPATIEQLQQAAEARQQAVDQIERTMDTTQIRELLLGNLDHPPWDDVARRCLSCCNCTMVCPTCFCSSVREVSDLTGDEVRRERVWDSCFNFDFSYMNGGVVRNQIRSRYRQWLTHKLASWIDQFGVSGCVGCGRCITWCPVGIDLTEEVAAIRGTSG